MYTGKVSKSLSHFSWKNYEILFVDEQFHLSKYRYQTFCYLCQCFQINCLLTAEYDTRPLEEDEGGH